MLILSGVFIFVGIVMIVGGMILRCYKQSQDIYKGTATGRVVELVMDKPDQEGERLGVHHYYYPVIAYYANGLLYKTRYDYGSNPSRFSMNEEVKICYDQEKPYRFEIMERNPAKLLAGVVYSVGFLFCIAGGVSFLMFATR